MIGPGFAEQDLSRLLALKVLKIGSDCFPYMNEFKLVGLKTLEVVVIGSNSFTKHKDSYGSAPKRHFVLKNCPSLKQLQIAEFSFSDYVSCEIEDMDALEVIEMGGVRWCSMNFYSGSLILRSVSGCQR